MNNLLVELLNRSGFPDMAVATAPGFRFGVVPAPQDSAGSRKPEPWAFDLVVEETGQSTWLHRESGLECRRETRVVDGAIIISSHLRHGGDDAICGISLLDPLCLKLGHPLQEWRLLFAHGGTSEGFYPPRAYRMQEASQLGWNFSIACDEQGRSSNLFLPFLMALTSDAEDSPGLFCAMEWSGYWSLGLDNSGDDGVNLRAGIKVNEMTLEPGETLRLPDVHLGFFRGGPDGGSNALRRYLYEHVCPDYEGRPVLPKVTYDSWFGIENALNDEVMKAQANRAAELGAEVFVVDGGWYDDGFPNGVGNWHRADPAKFADGLEPLAEYVRSLGMDFGLWFEIERAVEGTDVVRRHPEFFVPVPGWDGHPQFYHINLGLREAQDYVIETIGGWIERLDVRFSRWDYNINPCGLWEKADPSLKLQFAYFEGLYRVLDVLMQEHPRWMVECCASGGRRIDLGTLRRAHTCWFSDQTVIASTCRYMQARANRWLPGHLVNSSVVVGMPGVEASADPAAVDETAVLSRMLGKLAFDGNITALSEAQTIMARGLADRFKDIRHLMVQDFYQLAAQPQTCADWDAVAFVAHDGDEAAVFSFAGSRGGTRSFPVPGLRDDASYQITDQRGKSIAACSGDQLRQTGLEVTLHDNEGGLWSMQAE